MNRDEIQAIEITTTRNYRSMKNFVKRLRRKHAKITQKYPKNCKKSQEIISSAQILTAGG